MIIFALLFSFEWPREFNNNMWRSCSPCDQQTTAKLWNDNNKTIVCYFFYFVLHTALLVMCSLSNSSKNGSLVRVLYSALLRYAHLVFFHNCLLVYKMVDLQSIGPVCCGREKWSGEEQCWENKKNYKGEQSNCWLYNLISQFLIDCPPPKKKSKSSFMAYELFSFPSLDVGSSLPSLLRKEPFHCLTVR